MQAIFPIQYFGSISYYKDLVSCENVAFEIWDTYPKQTNRNRTSIYTSNGILELTIPVRKPNGSKTVTKDILIDNSQDWRKTHWRAIESAYKHSAYFEHYETELKALIYQEEKSLVLFNSHIFKHFCSWLQLPIQS